MLKLLSKILGDARNSLDGSFERVKQKSKQKVLRSNPSRDVKFFLFCFKTIT